ncbi:MAG TPA: pitrilysin family protein [Thermoanaerobaculia bacterium]|nr:pitrilysin family protein [Thermoanaerobaculia bacterium]HUM30762.1 pitrilysin family protein [Thermoanaerobaculia bacterium]HXK69038.1 pitrilysin family protein [Thermoanaerobaculia bacterium]
MRRVLLFAFITLMAFSLLAVVPQEFTKLSDNAPELRPLKTPDVQQITLKNGLRIMLVEDHRLPLVSGRLMYRGGSVFDPADKAGLAGIATEVMRTGGTEAVTGDDLSEMLESMSASVEAFASSESAYVSFNCLSENFTQVLDIFRDIVLNPAFREDKIQLAKDQIKSAISRRNDEAQEILSREFPRLLYGKDNPYVAIEEYATVDAITRDDLVAYHQRFFFPSNGILAIWGDIDAKAVAKTLKESFKGWEDNGRKVASYPKMKYDLTPGVYFSHKDGVNQSYIELGHFGIQRDNPDYYALEVMNRIFGMGGFASRLFKNIRSNKGLTYGVYGGVDWEYTHRGSFFVSTFTMSPKTVDAINAVIAEIRDIKTNGVTQEELDKAKKAFFEKFVFNFDTAGKLIGRLQSYAFYGMPMNSLDVLREKIKAVTVEDVNKVAAKYLDPDNLLIYVVGNKDEIDPSLSELGEVKEVDITIPAPKGEEAPEATEADLDKGRALMTRALKAHGGDAVLKVTGKEVEEELTMDMGGQQFTLTTVAKMVLPDKIHVTVTMPFGTIEQAYDGTTAWVKTPQGVQPYPAEEFKDEIMKEFFNLLNAVKNPDVTFQYAGTESLGDKTVDAVFVKKGEAQFKIFLDTKDHSIAGMKYQGKTQMGPAEMVQAYTDYQTVDGVVYPASYTVTANGEPYITSKVLKVVLSPTLDASIFAMPGAAE